MNAGKGINETDRKIRQSIDIFNGKIFQAVNKLPLSAIFRKRGNNLHFKIRQGLDNLYLESGKTFYYLNPSGQRNILAFTIL